MAGLRALNRTREIGICLASEKMIDDPTIYLLRLGVQTRRDSNLVATAPEKRNRFIRGRCLYRHTAGDLSTPRGGLLSKERNVPSSLAVWQSLDQHNSNVDVVTDSKRSEPL